MFISYDYKILTAYGFDNIESILQADRWNMWRAISEIATGEEIEKFYLYLKSRCRIDEAREENREKWAHLSNKQGYSLLFPPSSHSSITTDIERTKGAFGAKEAFTTKKFLLDRFQRLQQSTDWREISAEPHFIDPDLEFFDGPLLQGDNSQKTLRAINSVSDATSYMMKWLRGEEKGENEEACIAVLIADGGVGKTTLAHMLCRKIHDEAENTYPIFIEPEQWQKKVETDSYDLTMNKLTMDKIWEYAIRQRTSDPIPSDNPAESPYHGDAKKKSKYLGGVIS